MSEGVSGVHRNSPLNKLGMRASDTAQLFFDDVIVPAGQFELRAPVPDSLIQATSSARKAAASSTRCCSSKTSVSLP